MRAPKFISIRQASRRLTRPTWIKGDKAEGLLDLAPLPVSIPSTVCINARSFLQSPRTENIQRTRSTLEEIVQLIEKESGRSFGNPTAMSPLLLALRFPSHRLDKSLPPSFINIGSLSNYSFPLSNMMRSDRDFQLSRIAGTKGVNNSRLHAMRDAKPMQQLEIAFQFAQQVISTHANRPSYTLLIQEMVSGIMSANSGAGMAYTHNPYSVSQTDYGHFGLCIEGVRFASLARSDMRDIRELRDLCPIEYGELKRVLAEIEFHYHAIRYIEFVLQNGTVYVVQNTSGNPSAPRVLPSGAPSHITAMELLEYSGASNKCSQLTNNSKDILDLILKCTWQSEWRSQAEWALDGIGFTLRSDTIQSIQEGLEALGPTGNTARFSATVDWTVTIVQSALDGFLGYCDSWDKLAVASSPGFSPLLARAIECGLWRIIGIPQRRVIVGIHQRCRHVVIVGDPGTSIGPDLRSIVRLIHRCSAEKTGAIMLHAAAAVYKSAGILIVGEKGVGKTTVLCSLVNENDSAYLSGDRTYVQSRGGKVSLVSFIDTFRPSLKTASMFPKLFASVRQSPQTSGDTSSVIRTNKLRINPTKISSACNIKQVSESAMTVVLFPRYTGDINGYSFRQLDTGRIKSALSSNVITQDADIYHDWLGLRDTSSADFNNQHEIFGEIGKMRGYEIIGKWTPRDLTKCIERILL